MAGKVIATCGVLHVVCSFQTMSTQQHPGCSLALEGITTNCKIPGMGRFIQWRYVGAVTEGVKIAAWLEKASYLKPFSSKSIDQQVQSYNLHSISYSHCELLFFFNTQVNSTNILLTLYWEVWKIKNMYYQNLDTNTGTLISKWINVNGPCNKLALNSLTFSFNVLLQSFSTTHNHSHFFGIILPCTPPSSRSQTLKFFQTTNYYSSVLLVPSNFFSLPSS